MMVLAQLFAFDRVTQVRSERRERTERHMEEKEQQKKRDDEVERDQRAKAQANGESARGGRLTGNGKINPSTNGRALKPLDRPGWREESSSENDSLPPS